MFTQSKLGAPTSNDKCLLRANCKLLLQNGKRGKMFTLGKLSLWMERLTNVGFRFTQGKLKRRVLPSPLLNSTAPKLCMLKTFCFSVYCTGDLYHFQWPPSFQMKFKTFWFSICWIEDLYHFNNRHPFKWNSKCCGDDIETSQELWILPSVTLNWKVTKIVMDSGFQLSEL